MDMLEIFWNLALASLQLLTCFCGPDFDLMKALASICNWQGLLTL